MTDHIAPPMSNRARHAPEAEVDPAAIVNVTLQIAAFPGFSSPYLTVSPPFKVPFGSARADHFTPHLLVCMQR